MITSDVQRKHNACAVFFFCFDSKSEIIKDTFEY